MKRPVASSTVTTDAFGAIRFGFGLHTCEAGLWWLLRDAVGRLKLQFHPPLYANA